MEKLHFFRELVSLLNINSKPKEIIELIEKGLDVNTIEENSGKTPLKYALEFSNSAEVIKILIEKGADVNSREKGDYTPLVYAVKYHSNPEIIKLLIKNGACVYNILKIAKENRTKNKDKIHKLILINLDFLTTDFWKTATLEMVKKGISEGADVNVKNTHNMTMLMFAAKYNNNDKIIKYLIEKGADVNPPQNSDFMTPLLYASGFSSNPEIIRILIEKGAKINEKGTYGFTPLICALLNINRKREIINLFIEKGLIIQNDKFTLFIQSIVNNNINNVITFIKQNKTFPCNEILKDTSAILNSYTPLTLAIEYHSNLEIIKLLMDKIDKKKANYYFCLNGELKLAAKYSNNPDVIKLFLKNGVSINQDILSDAKENNTKNKEKIVSLISTNLDFLSDEFWKTATVENVKKKISNGAEVNANCDLFTPLFLAVLNKCNLEIIELLANKGAKIYAEENNMLILLENEKVLKILQEKRAFVNIRKRYK